jgi:hypothetical protein
VRDHEDRWYYDVTDSEWPTQLDAPLQRRGDGFVLLRGGSVITLDKELGDFDRGDILVKGNRILRVGADLSGAAADSNAIVIDVKGMIVMPGLVDGHKRCWQNLFRGLIVDASIGEYMATVHAGFAKAYDPEDMFVGDMVTTLGLLDCGVTTVLDFSHNTRSPDTRTRFSVLTNKPGFARFTPPTLPPQEHGTNIGPSNPLELRGHSVQGKFCLFHMTSWWS